MRHEDDSFRAIVDRVFDGWQSCDDTLKNGLCMMSEVRGSWTRNAGKLNERRCW